MARTDDLDNLEKIKEIDKAGMLTTVADMPEMFLAAQNIAAAGTLPEIQKIKNIIIAGMGGSAIAGDIVADLLAGTSTIPIYVNRDYRIPAFIGKETLFIALSYSGNTEETLSAVTEAAKAEANIVCVTSGGKLKEMAEAKKYPKIIIPSGYQPRAALPFLLVPLCRIIEAAIPGIGLNAAIMEAVKLLPRLRKEYGLDKPSRVNPVKRLAEKILGKIPIIFAVSGTSAAAGLRWKTQLNENGKATALFSLFPELNHNEIVNLASLKREAHNFSLIVLRDDLDHERVKKKIEITKSLLANQIGGINEIVAQGKTPCEKVLSLIYFGDFLSVYLAVLKGVDPTPVEVIEKLKKEMRR